MTELKRAVIWKAVSSEAQAKDDMQSLPYQEQLARAWCEKNGYTVTALLELPGHSRSESDVITALEELAAVDCFAYHDLRRMWQQRAFDMLIVHTIDRLARSRSLFIWVVENVIKSGSEIYFMSPGVLFNRGNVDYAPAMAMMGLRAGLDAFFEKSKATKMAKVAQGIPIQGKKPFGFITLYDGKHRPCGIAPDETRRTLLADAAALLLEGVSLRQIEVELFRRFGHNRNGKPYPNNFFRNVFDNPWTWGHAAAGHNDDKQPGGQATHYWLFDSSIPVPEHITIHWNSHPSLYPGETGERLKEELRRRRLVVKGRGTAKAQMFTGLVVCGWCGHAMTRNTGGPGANPRIRCQTNHRRNRAADCPNPGAKTEGIMEWRVQDYVQSLLQSMLDRHSPLLETPDEVPDREALIRQNAGELERLRRETLNLITRSAASPSSVVDLFQSQIDERAARMEALEALNGRLSAQLATLQPFRQTAAFEEVVTAGADFWTLPHDKINRILHALFGNLRLVVKDNRIVGRARM